MNLTRELIIKPGKKVRLDDIDPDATPGFDSREEALAALEQNKARMAELDALLYAENRRSVLVVLQAMDAGGKDGAIRHVMTGFNPQGCKVKAFKAPSTEELDHDFLWRIHRAVPAKGEIGVFNRSHYEDVLVVRVHNLVPKSVWSRRYDQINTFEKQLAENEVTILKFFLHISEEEQKKRLEARIKDPSKNWKIAMADIEERKLWDDYQTAYEDAISKCNTKWAPWFVIPANNKWYRNVAISQIMVEAIESLDMKYPKPSVDLSKLVVE